MNAMVGKVKKSKQRKKPVKKLAKKVLKKAKKEEKKKKLNAATEDTEVENTDLEDDAVDGDEPPPSSFST
jgi:hypothetical protein